MTDKDLTPAAVEALFGRELDAAYSALGCFNLGVFGKTGVGKSTLINAVFGSDVAPTGVGSPITKGVVYHRHPSAPVGVFDSEGFETGVSTQAIVEGLQTVVTSRRDSPMDQRIHAVWYLVRWSDRRFEESQETFVRALSDLGLPVIVVLTQVPVKDGVVHPEAEEFAHYITGLHLPISGPILTNALADPFSGSPQYGLQDLLDATYAVIPEAVSGALTAAQVVDIGRKKKEVAAVIAQAVAVASGIGATPIPFADAALLVPNQVTMIARITAAYGLPAKRSRAMAIAGSVVLTGGATMAGRYAVTSLLKFVPGGAIAGSMISAAVAGTLTKAVGHAWARVCEYALSLPADSRDAFWASDAVVETFTRYLKP